MSSITIAAANVHEDYKLVGMLLHDTNLIKLHFDVTAATFIFVGDKVLLKWNIALNSRDVPSHFPSCT